MQINVTISSIFEKQESFHSMRQYPSSSVHQQDGGTKSPTLCLRTWKLLEIQNKILLRAAHLAGHLNLIADHLSRVNIQHTDWSLNSQVLNQIFNIWEKPMVHLFASRWNHKTPIYCSWIPDQNALAVDALSIQCFLSVLAPIDNIPVGQHPYIIRLLKWVLYI